MSIVPYLLKLSICLAVIYLFYQLVLRRLTFYNWNPWYLLLYSFLAFFLPFINLSPVLEKQQWTGNGLVKMIPAVGDYELMKVSESITEKLDWPSIFIISGFIIGMLVMVVRLGIQYISLLRLRKSAQLILDDKVKVYQVNQSIIPFSFGNAIYLNQHLHNEEELKEIIRHEFVHVKQRHSLDIIWIELFCLLNWYNPFAWLMRKAIKQNLEFIADRQVLQNGFDRKQYQYLLLKVTGAYSFSIASNFNFSSLKKRIAMMNKAKSAKVHLTRFLFVLPLLIVVLVAFRNTVQQGNTAKQNILLNDTIPGKFKGLPGNVKSIQTTSNDKEAITIVTLKNGQTEKYNLNNEEERQAFEKKYGKMPEPPAAPLAPEAPEIEEVEMPLAPPVMEVPSHLFEPRDCFNKKGYCITIADNNGECVVIVKDKDMKILEAVKLTDWDENKEKYEGKYGQIPPPPPPPVPPAKAKPGSVPKPPAPPAPPAKGVSGVHIQSDDDLTTAAGTNEAVVAGNGHTVNASAKAPSRTSANVSGRGSSTKTTSVNISSNGTNEVNVSGTTTGMAAIAGGEPAEQEILGVIRNTSTREQLDQILKDLKAKGYIMKIEKTNFKDGKLQSIAGTVTDENGSSKWTFSATDFAKVTITIAAGKKGSRFINIIVSDGKVIA